MEEWQEKALKIHEEHGNKWRLISKILLNEYGINIKSDVIRQWFRIGCREANGHRINMIGQIFGRLTVIEYGYTDNGGNAHWKCKCDCGNETTVFRAGLKSGGTKSCGCFQRENASKINTKHGKSNSSIHNTWNGMIQRCENEKSKDYYRYGERGIKVCQEWKDFNVFYRDMGDKPEGLTIDRIDNDKGYYKENCRWANIVTQNNNRGKYNSFITYNGETKTISQWAYEMGIKASCLWMRINEYKWSIEKSLNVKSKSWNKKSYG